MWVAENKVAPLSESHPELQIAEQVDDMMQKALRRDPDKRYQSAFAFRNAIKEFRQSAAARTVARPVELPKTDPISSVAAATASPPATRGGGWLLGWIAAGVLAVLGGVAGFLYLGERSQAQESERQLTKVATAFSDLGFDGDVDAGLGSLRSRLIELEEAAGTADPAERAALDARIVKLKKDVETAAADRDAARGELAARQATLDAKELELGKARGDLTRVESQLETANKQLEGLRNAVNPDTAELSEARQRITELKGNVGDLQTSVKVLEGEKTALEKEKGALEAQLSLSGESARKVVELEGKISALEGERDTLRSEKASTESARKALEVRNGELESSNADNRKKLEDVRGELATARRARDTLDAEVKGLRADNARLENSSGTSAADREELARLRSVEARLKSQVVDANKRVTELQDENRRLKARRGLPLGRPFNVILHNAHKSDVRINEVVASGAYGTRKVAVPTKDKANEVSLGKDLTLAVPGGTTRILVRFYRRHYANRRWQIRTIELKATVSPSRVKVLVK